MSKRVYKIIDGRPSYADLVLQGHIKQDITPLETGESTVSSYVKLGKDIETGEPFYIDDSDRYGGFYVLGEPRTGKSYLLTSLALQDIDRGHGLLFIDPHSDAIEEIIARMPERRIHDVILLDPTNDDHAFGINPLYCTNPNNLRERQLCFAQAREVFTKVFGEEDEKLGILLSKYLGNCLYPLIENQGYTLYDIVLFLRSKYFRESLLKNIKFHPEVVEFWHDEFDRMPLKDQREEVQSLLNRIESLRRNPYIKHVISQAKPMIDFADIMQTKKIVLLRIPSWQDDESKPFIGTLVISQLLKVIFLRADISEHLRIPFALYCDEFQTFVTPDFAKLFTQTGKFNIMPMVAHQVRVGQFKQGDPNRGATLAARGKALFRLSVLDSQELAPVVAKSPPTETKLERQLAISQEPVSELMRGHPNPEIRRFVDQYLRRLQYRLEDIKEDMEGEQLIRTALLDEVALSRVDERREAIFASMARGRDIPVSYKALENTERVLVRTQEQTDKLRSLHESATRTRFTIRSFNSFLTALMEGRLVLRHGQESYSAFLIAAVRGLMNMPARYTTFNPLLLYIAVAYGDPQIPRTIPYDFARIHGLFSDEVTMLIRQSIAKTRQAKEAFQERYLKERLSSLEIREKKDYSFTHILTREREKRLAKIEEKYYREPFPVDEESLWHAPRIYVTNVWRMCYPKVDSLVSPYAGAQFTPQWKRLVTDNLIRRINESFHESSTPGADLGKWYKRYVNWGVIDNLVRFLRQYREGAFVMLALIDCARSGGWHFDRRHGYPYSNRYTSMINFPAIAGVEPIEVLRVVKKLNDFMMGKEEDYVNRLQYFDRKPSRSWKTNELMWKKQNFFERSRSLRTEEYLSDITDEKAFRSLGVGQLYGIGNQEQMQLLETMLTDRRIWFGHQYPEWSYSDELTRSYFLARASDLISFGENLANQTFPQPTGAEGLVSALVGLYEDVTRAKLEAEWEERVARERQWTEERSAYQIAKISVSTPEHLEPRVLSGDERKKVKEACRNELLYGEEGVWGKAVLTVLEDFVEFCHLISLPENHIKVQTGQYIEKQVNARQYVDMEKEMAQELSRLPERTAYIRVNREKNGEREVLIRKIKTLQLTQPRLQGGELAKRKSFIEANMLGLEHVKERGKIEEEIRLRQEKWRSQTPESTRRIPPPDEPPPSSY